MFKNLHIDLGTLRPSVPTRIEFPYDGELEIKGLAATCGCTEPIWDKEGKKVTATFTPNPVPQHLKMQGKTSYVSDKSILVGTATNEITLSFTALIQE